MSLRRVVITGLGFCTSLGTDRDQIWTDLQAGRSGISTITRFDTTGFTSAIGGEIRDLDRERWMSRRVSKRVDDFTAYALCAGKQAVDDGGLDPAAMNLNRAAVIMGTGIGGIQEIEIQHELMLERGPQKVSPFFVPKLMANAAVGQLTIELGFRGASFSVASACASGAHASGMALRAIQHGEAEVILTGGSEATLTKLGLIGFCSARALSTRNDDPEHASRPFDLHRDGFVMGEGAGCLIFEELEHARARGARIYAEVVGYGASSDAYHMTAPSPGGEGAARAIRQALHDGGIPPERVDYCNAHGTSTPLNDRLETAAIKLALGEEHARRIAISSTKSMLGHLLGAAPGVELAVTALSIRDGIVHPTANLETPDPDCDLDYVQEGVRQLPIDVAICNSLGFGGHNACIALARYS
jgi:3-oxoacyl-[acyl-carrier-protein] synthase II